MWKILSISFQTRQSSSTIFYSPKSISISSPHLLLRNCSKALLSLSFPLPHCYTIMYYFLRLCTTILQSMYIYSSSTSVSRYKFNFQLPIFNPFSRPLYRFPVLRGQERVPVHLHTHETMSSKGSTTLAVCHWIQVLLILSKTFQPIRLSCDSCKRKLLALSRFSLFQGMCLRYMYLVLAPESLSFTEWRTFTSEPWRSFVRP